MCSPRPEKRYKCEAQTLEGLQIYGNTLSHTTEDISFVLSVMSVLLFFCLIILSLYFPLLFFKSLLGVGVFCMLYI